MKKDYIAKDWGTGQIDLRGKGKVLELRPDEFHHKSNGARDGGPSFTIVFGPSIPGVPSVVGQVSFDMLKQALGELGYQLKRPEHEVWRWWVGMDELPRYVKLNPYNTVGERKVFKMVKKHEDGAGHVWIETDDPNVGAKGHLEAYYLLPATFEEYQQFMNAEAV